MRSTGHVFVSSTCYDLLDLRASLEGTLRQCGLRPVMSDRPTSEFTNPGDVNSIETCLVNLRRCERCIVVLSQRYGPSLKNHGFDDVSATHLEYRTAVKEGVPVLVYVRDRLWAEFDLWRKNAGLKPIWAKQDDATALFGFIQEHAILNPSKTQGNWMWPFTSAGDLCERVLGDLGATASAAMVRQLSQRGMMPQLSIEVMGERRERSATIQNAGMATALRTTVRDPFGKSVLDPRDLPGGEWQKFIFDFDLSAFSAPGGLAPVLRVFYDTATGERLCDIFGIVPNGAGMVRTVPVGRVCLGGSLRMSCPELVVERGVTYIPMKVINDAFGSDML